MNTILLILLFIGLAVVYIRSQRREIADGIAAWWSNVCEPRIYIMYDIEDNTVSERAANARAKLVKHGNPYLNPERDVYEFIYRADPMAPTMNFELWYDTKLQEAQRIREAWRAQKSAWSQEAAKQQFAGQKPAAEWTTTTATK